MAWSLCSRVSPGSGNATPLAIGRTRRGVTTIDQLLEAAASEADPERRRDLFFQFQQVVHDDVPSIELGANPNVTIAARNLHDWGRYAGGTRASFADAYFSQP